MLNNEQLMQYLERIGYKGSLTSCKSTLDSIHQCHMKTVPFENLDIHLGNRINLSINSIFEKIVVNKRGGFCYELNLMLYALLKTLGFNVDILSARVYDDADLGPEFDHMLLLIDIHEERLVADVGFGDSFLEPLSIDSMSVAHLEVEHKITHKEKAFILEQKDANKDWVRQYLFSLKPRAVNDFAEMCEFQQTSTESNFTKKSVCSLATNDGRLTVTNGRLIKTKLGKRSELTIKNQLHYRELLLTMFNMSLPNDMSSKMWSKLGIKSAEG